MPRDHTPPPLPVMVKGRNGRPNGGFADGCYRHACAITQEHKRSSMNTARVTTTRHGQKPFLCAVFGLWAVLVFACPGCCYVPCCLPGGSEDRELRGVGLDDAVPAVWCFLYV